MEKSASPFHAPPTGKRASSVIEQIFAAEHPDHFTRSIPAQRLYLAVREQGLPSSSEVIEMASREQIQLMLDFDLWSYDRFEEDQVWEWLELPEATDDLLILQKILHSIDPKLIVMLMNRHVQIESTEEPTDPPPGDGFYTPDKGYTWLKVTLEDGRKEFLFKRLLALIFETSAELFYQIIKIPTVATPSVLEEESYQEKSKRLSSEGFPDDEWANALNSPLELDQAVATIAHAEKREAVRDIYSIPVFVRSYSTPQPLRSVLEDLDNFEEVERELTLLCNSALIHFRIPTWEQDEVFTLVEQIRGAINIGLQLLMNSEASFDGKGIHQAIGLQGMYKVGLGAIFSLRKRARTLSDECCNGDSRLLTLLDGLRQKFPILPGFLLSDGTFDENHGKLKPGFRPLEIEEDVAVSEVLLAQLSK